MAKENNKGGAPKDHWEMKYTANPKESYKSNPQNTFNPRCAYERKKLYPKVNETDH